MDPQSLKPPKWLIYFGSTAMVIGLLVFLSGFIGGNGDRHSQGATQTSYEEVTLDQLETQLMNPDAKRPPMKQLTFEERNNEQFPHSAILEWTTSGQQNWRAVPMTQNDYDKLRTTAKDHKVASVEKKIEAAEGDASGWSSYIWVILLVVVLFSLGPLYGLWQMTRAFTRSGGGDPGKQTLDKEVGQWTDPEKLTETFDDVAGIDEVTDDLKLLIEMMKDPTRLKDKFGASVPKGVIFTGPPGVGKTLCARVVAKMSGLPFFSIAGSSFEEVYVGVGAARARKMFEDAKKRGPCVIFIDEIDAVGRKRQNGPGGVGDATLNQLLVLMDGFFESQAIIIAATNRDDILDDALLRRLPWKINFPLPDQSGRLKILQVHARKKPLRKEDLLHVAATTQGFSGDGLRNMLNESAIAASQRTKAQEAALVASGMPAAQAQEQVPNVITAADLFEGLLRHLMGPARKNLVMDTDELIATAIHELWGHAFCCAYQRFRGETKDVVRFVTIQPRSRAGGLAFITPERDIHYHTEDYIKSQAVTAFGGSAAELEALSQKTSGIDNDFEKAYQSIHRAVVRWGMSDKVGIISVGQHGHTAATEIGVTQRDNIDEECKRIGNEMHQEARRIVRMCLSSEHSWEALEDLLQNRIMVQERFAQHAQRVFKDIESHPEWNVEALTDQTRARCSQRIAALAAKYHDVIEMD